MATLVAGCAAPGLEPVDVPGADSIDGGSRNNVVPGNNGGQGGNGGIAFSTANHPVERIEPGQVLLSDLNRDGALDAVVATAGDGIGVFLGDGRGAFGPVRIIPLSARTVRMSVLDMDRDGVIDLVSVGYGSLSVFRGRGDGTFDLPIVTRMGFGYGLAVGDLNEDGWPDAAVAMRADGVDYAYGAGGGRLDRPLMHVLGKNPQDVYLARLDGDAHLDAIVLDGLREVAIVRNAGAYNDVAFYRLGFVPRRAAVGDLDGDGAPDLAFTGPFLAVMIQAGQAALGPPVRYAGDCTEIAIGDLDGDRKPDLSVTSVADRSLRVLRGVGDGTFMPPSVYPLGVKPGGLAAGDLDRDGRLDLVVSDQTHNQLLVLHNVTVL